MERVRKLFSLLLLLCLLLSAMTGAVADDGKDGNDNNDGNDNDNNDNDDNNGNHGRPCPVLSLWQLGKVYKVGDKVLGPTLDRVFQCKAKNLCGLLQYEILPPGFPTTYLKAWKQSGPLCFLPGGACPTVDWVLGKAYATGATVSVDVNGFTHTFKCTVGNLCGLADHQPLLGSLWKKAWKDLGMCQVPGGLCPALKFVVNRAYKVGTLVQVTDALGVVHSFSCKKATLCGKTDYVPLVGRLYRNAWQDLGECRLQAGLCPVLSWVLKAPYKVGSLIQVTVDGTVHTLQCLLGSNKCGLLANQPLLGSTWRSAWRDLGACVQKGGLCPALDWVLNTVYTVGATVQVDVDGIPHTFRCQVANLCGLADHQPLIGSLFREAWKDLGVCHLKAGACPKLDWVVNTTYALGSQLVAELDGVAHSLVCKAPALCGLLTHQPLLGDLWRNAFIDLGECSLSGGVCSLADWVLNKVYTAGATVSVDVNGEQHTFVCKVANLCGLANYQPLLGSLWDKAWQDLGECKLLGGVCPLVNWVLNATFNLSSTVVAELGDTTHTLVCIKPELCGLADYEPFVGELFRTAWRDLGECEAKVGVCNAVEWVLNTTYAVGQQVQRVVDGTMHTFVCNLVDVCGLVDREPLVGALWQAAWTDLGVCNLRLTLKLCPVLEFVAGQTFALGQTVSVTVDGVTHTAVCMVPSLCGLATHAPLVGLLWRLAWADLGQCLKLDVCPLLNWVLDTAYETGATVTVLSDGANHTFVCRVDDLCGLANYKPLVGRLWRQAWSDLGVCGDNDTMHTGANGFDLVLAMGRDEAEFEGQARELRAFGTMAAEEEFAAYEEERRQSAAKGADFFSPLVGKIAAGSAGALFAMVVAMGVLLARERRRHRNIEEEEELSTI